MIVLNEVRKIFILILFVVLQNLNLHGQTAHQLNSWWTYSGNHKISKKISLHTLYSWRRSNFANTWQQSLLRLGLNYQYTDKLILSSGYDWVITYPYGEQPIGQETTEKRIYEQVVLKNKIKQIGISHRYRLEQRFNNKITKHRVRYRMSMKIPLNFSGESNNKLFISLFDELFVNIGSNSKGHYFDQNWFYAGLGLPIQKGLVVTIGYMNQYLVKSDNLHVEDNHTPQLGLSYNIDLRKNK